MSDVLKDIEMVVFDLMGVIITNSSLVRKGLFTLYGDSYSQEYIKGLYSEVRSNREGDSSLWDGLGEGDYHSARARFLGQKYMLNSNFNNIRNFLKERGIQMSVLSNMPVSWGDYLCKRFNLNDDFNPKLFSGAVGISKPNRGIFLEFFKQARIDPGKMLFIDDKLKNLKTASELGMKTVLFSRQDKEKSQKDFSPDYTISSFKELMS